MNGTSSSSSSLSSFGSFDDVAVEAATAPPIKLLCSYGGMILPCRPDGRLRYVGGHTRVLAVRRPIPFSELQAKLRELCGWKTVSLRCQLPTEDLDALVSVTSDEDLANLIEEYGIASRDRPSPLKIRAFLLPSSTASPSKPSIKTPPALVSARRPPVAAADRPALAKHNARCEKPAAPAAAAAADRCFHVRRHQLGRRGYW